MSTRLVEYLATTRLGERGTMTLPKEYRDELGLNAGAPLTLLRIGSGLLLVPEQQRFEDLCRAIATRLENAGITESDLQATLPEVREKIARQRYPRLFAANRAPRGRRGKARKAMASKKSG